MRWFQWCLNHLKLSFVGLHIFIDSFTGCYKDGTEPGTRDCRYFAALFFSLRIVYYIATASGGLSYFVILGFSYAAFTFLFAWCQPYKEKFSRYTAITIILLVMGQAYVLITMGFMVGDVFNYQRLIIKIICCVLVAIPVFYFIELILKWIWYHSPLKEQYRLCKYFKRTSEVSVTTGALFDIAENRKRTTQPMQNYGAVTSNTLSTN